MLSLVLGAAIAASPTADLSKIQWMHDDAPGAFAKAKKAKQLVAVDVWGTWCHTCLMMQNFALKERPMAKVANKLVFLAMEYESDKNTDFFAKFPINAFPTFLVIDPKTEKVVARWVGSGTSEQMAEFFATADPSDDRPSVRAQRLIAKRSYAEAIEILEGALAKASATERNALYPPYIEALWKHDTKACATKGAEHLDRFDDRTAAGIDSMLLLSYCATALEDPKPLYGRLAKRLATVAAKPPKSLEADEVAGVMLGLADVYDALGEKKNGDAAAKRAATVLEQAAKRAPSIAVRTTYDYHRLLAYVRLGRHAEALKMLTASEKAQPDDFNHPHRIAYLYLELGKTKEGLAAIDRALKIGYGGRRLRLHATKIDLLLKANRLTEAQAQVDAAKKELASMNPANTRQGWIDMLEARAKKVEAQLKSRG
ncbi:MAG: thioredoxin family protein [Deltaproteobacteria bacterium]